MIAQIFTIVAPVFIIIGMGYAAVRLKYFSIEGVRYVMTYAQNFAVPLLLFNAMIAIDFEKNFRADILASYFIPMGIVFAAGFWAGRILGRDNMAATVLAFNAFFANSVLLGLPISERAFGEGSLAINYVLISFHSPFAYLLGSLTMEFAKPREPKFFETLLKAFQELMKNPLIIGILFGLSFNLLNIQLPEIFEDAVTMQARAALPAALFALGGVLTGFQIKGVFTQMVAISFIRLFLHPALVLLFSLFIFRLPIEVAQTLILVAAMPSGTNGFIFASLYKTCERTAASIVFLSTLLSILTIPIWLSVLVHL